MQTILGASGTIGKLLARELVPYTDRIRLVSRNPRKVNDGDELHPADLLVAGAADDAVRGSDIVYLVVGLEYRLKVWEEQWPAIMSATLSACIRHDAKLVFFDNVYMYDCNYMSDMTESTPVNPSSKKGEVRRKISDMLMETVTKGKLRALIARAADFYGPGNENSFVTQMVVKNLSSGKKAMWFINPGFNHTFTYTPDAARATALLGNTPDAYGEVWHLPADSRKITAGDFISMFASEFNVNPGITALPRWMLYPLGLFIPVMKEMPEMMYQYDRDYFFNSSKFTRRFGSSATPYEEGVKETCRLFKG